VNDSVFTTDTLGQSFILNQLIKGWQLGLPQIKKGGSIKLYIPPSLAYGATGNGIIPGNSNLIYEVSLLDVAN
jgi:FKBP-type peptidyl-prolyl cis-trans isomerase FkpA